MKRALVPTAVFLLLSSSVLAASSSSGPEPAAPEGCAPKVETFRLLTEIPKKEDTPAASVELTPQPTGKENHRVKLESNDDLASLSFPAGFISPYVGASINLLPLPNYDPETAPAQVLAYGLGAGFGCDLGGSTRLNLRYQIRFYPEDEPLLDTENEGNETHRISLGLQKSF